MLRYDLAAALVADSECRVEIKRHSDEHGVVSEVHADFLEPGQDGTIERRDKYSPLMNLTQHRKRITHERRIAIY